MKVKKTIFFLKNKVMGGPVWEGKVDEKGVDQSGGKLYLIYYWLPKDYYLLIV